MSVRWEKGEAVLVLGLVLVPGLAWAQVEAEPVETDPVPVVEAIAAAPTPPPTPVEDPQVAAARVEAAFGDALLESGDAYRAITAYKKARFLAPRLQADLLDYRIALAYLAGGQHEAAWSAARQVKGRPELVAASRRLGAAALYAAGEHDAVIGELAGDESGWAHYQLGFAHLFAWRTDEARRAFASVEASAPRHAAALGLVEALTPPVRVPHRSPALAGMLSLIPGLGHLYLGDVGVATSALLWNGAFGFGLYQTIRAGLWGLVALVAVLESVWYFGTIYGAIAGAQRFNRDAKLGWAEGLRDRFGPPGPPPAPALPGVAPLNLQLQLP